jgi:hypothetical protein
MSLVTAETFVRVGMLAVIRDIQDWTEGHADHPRDCVDLNQLRGYLLACVITAGGYEAA